MCTLKGEDRPCQLVDEAATLFRLERVVEHDGSSTGFRSEEVEQAGREVPEGERPLVLLPLGGFQGGGRREGGRRLFVEEGLEDSLESGFLCPQPLGEGRRDMRHHDLGFIWLDLALLSTRNPVRAGRHRGYAEAPEAQSLRSSTRWLREQLFCHVARQPNF